MNELPIVGLNFADFDLTAPDEVDCDLDLTRTFMRRVAEDLGRRSNELAVQMILRGMFPSQGYGVAYTVNFDGNVLRYDIYPANRRGQRVPLQLVSGGESDNPGITSTEKPHGST